MGFAFEKTPKDRAQLDTTATVNVVEPAQDGSPEDRIRADLKAIRNLVIDLLNTEYDASRATPIEQNDDEIDASGAALGVEYDGDLYFITVTPE